MLPMRKLLCALLLCSMLGATAAATPALASQNETVYFEAPKELLSSNAMRQKTIATLQAQGVHALRLQLFWRSVAPAAKSSRRPSFDATNPANYNWGQYVPLLAEAHALHWTVLLTVTSPVPTWATAGHNDKLGITRPNDREFQRFMTAVGREFGSEVALYAIWNEPNHPRFLRPQFNSNGLPASPRIYRGLFQAGYEGLKAAGMASPKVLFGETAPGGETRINPREGLLKDVAPLVFLREALCLNNNYRKAGTCSALHASGYAHHAYSMRAAGPFYIPPGKDNVTIGVLSRLSQALDRAAAAHAISPHLPIYLTEFGVESKPNKYLGVSVGQQAEYDAISEKIAYQNPRVASFSQYLMRDDPLSGVGASGGVGFQTGLEYLSGTRKPLYFGFPIPLVVSKRGHGYSLWGLVRPATGPTQLTVLVQPPHSRRFRKLRVLTTNSSGSWRFNSSTAGSAWRVQWRSPKGVAYNGPTIRAY
jgi:hypothetical protein